MMSASAREADIECLCEQVRLGPTAEKSDKPFAPLAVPLGAYSSGGRVRR